MADDDSMEEKGSEVATSKFVEWCSKPEEVRLTREFVRECSELEWDSECWRSWWDM